MKKSFKFVSVLVLFAFLLSTVPSAFAASHPIYYSVVDNHAVVDCQLGILSGDVVIDSTYEGCPVTEFTEPESAYIFSSGVTSITLPKSIDAEKLTGFPFCGCPDAKIILAADNTELLLEGNVLYNKDKTRLIRYQNNPNSKSFTVPESVVEIGAFAFTGSNLEELTIPNSKTKIDYDYSERSFGDYEEYSINGHNIKNIYYGGTEEEWKSDYDNELFSEGITVHFSSDNSGSSNQNTTGIMGILVMFVNNIIVPALNVILDYIKTLILSLT